MTSGSMTNSTTKYEPFELPNDQCVRMTRSEMSCCRMIMSLANNLQIAQEDLKKRLEIIPNGAARMKKLLEDLDTLFLDLRGTISDRQRKQLRNSAKDMVFQLVPKITSNGNRVMISIDEMKELTECAMEKCKSCADSGEEAKKCRLYQWLETNIPLDDYGDDLICPYAREEWGE